MPPSAAPREPSRSRRLWVWALVLAAAAGAGLAGQQRKARSNARAHALELAGAGAELARCVRRALPPAGKLGVRLLGANAAPLADCRRPLEQLDASLGRYRALSSQRAAAQLVELEATLQRVRGFPFQALPQALDKQGGVTQFAVDVDRCAEIACEAAVTEGAGRGPCAPPLRVPAPTPAARRLVSATTAKDATVHFRAFARGDQGGVVLLAVDARPRGELIALSTRDGGANFSVARAALELDASARVEHLRLTGDHLAVLSLSDGTLRAARLSEDGAQLQWASSFDVPPPGQRRVLAGTPLLQVGEGPGAAFVELFAPSVAGAKEGGSLRYRDAAGRTRTRAVPGGRVAGGLGIHGPRVVTLRRAATEFVEFDVFTVPEFGDPFGEPQRVSVPYVPSLELEPEPENVCGLPGEKLSLLLGRGVYDALVALDREKAFPFKLGAHPLSEIRPVCGACPPSALELSRPPQLFVPVRRNLAGIPIAGSLALEATDARATLQMSCASDAMLLSYVVDGHLVAQRTEESGWSFGPATLLDVPDASGRVVEVQLLGFRDRVLVLWRRQGVGELSLHATFQPAPPN